MAVISMVDSQENFFSCRQGAFLLSASFILSRIHKATGAGSFQKIYRKYDQHLWGRPQRATVLTNWGRKYMLGFVHHSSRTPTRGPLVFDRNPVVG